MDGMKVDKSGHRPNLNRLNKHISEGVPDQAEAARKGQLKPGGGGRGAGGSTGTQQRVGKFGGLNFRDGEGKADKC